MVLEASAVNSLVAGSKRAGESLGRSLISGVGCDENVVICQLILKYFNISPTAMVIQVHLGPGQFHFLKLFTYLFLIFLLFNYSCLPFFPHFLIQMGPVEFVAGRERLHFKLPQFFPVGWFV